MKVFISSVITGLEAHRDAATRAIRSLRHEPLRAEDFGARPESPQRVCLGGVRQADVVVLILGARYGDLQPSGLSATHEEYREARDTKHVLAFVQSGAMPEPEQAAFIREVQEWNTGLFTSRVETSDELFETVIGELHRLELAMAAGAPDEAEMLERANGMVPDERSLRDTSVSLVVTAGPRQQILRPAEIEAPALSRKIRNEALVGQRAVLDPQEGTTVSVVRGSLLLQQESASLLVDPLGSIRVVQPARTADDGAFLVAVIEEELQERLVDGMRLAAWVLDEIDPRGRVTHVLPLVSILGAGYRAWRTRAEHARNPNSGTISMRSDETVSVALAPPLRSRAALTHNVKEMAEDFVVLLRREFKQDT